MKDFLFAPEQARTPLRVLSGGERGRLMLARALAKPSNLLVLDEPTNDLDLETLDVLEEMLGDYAGTVILISHDRDFLDRVVHAVIVPEGNGRWTEYAGGYADMLAQRGGDAAGRAPAVKAAGAPKARRRRRAAAPQLAKRRAIRQATHELSGAAGTQDAARADRDVAGEHPDTAGEPRRPRRFTRATGMPSPTRRRSSGSRRASLRTRRRNGWSWRSCARRSRAASQDFCARASHAIAPCAASAPVEKQACRR